ncbi:malto-oligosyltrehalose synthase [Azoarcus sp. KH32C]|uniref:malto-oligosyltrehalose synthase n=1 Tax=Azoarcus sp. KH32C TaxID=748247 RepID=UPI0002386DB4|nr:malto-oligosyltrehalose synthase [Azoarcus sp. KH32C]BAL24936.1 bifunctional 4-alpha-glucanotransferase/malto-oligosyltrehalose synthase [Azoarcus sp. KH32C]
MASDAVDALCRFLGIEPDYEDGEGRYAEVSRECKIALLEALGHPLDPKRPDEDAASRLEALRRQADSRVMPPMLVLEAAPLPLRLPVRFPAGLAGRTLWWRIALEQGGERQGQLTVDVLPEAEAPGDAHVATEIALALSLPQGYHRLSLHERPASSTALAETMLAICPPSCKPAGADRLWGPSVQVYALSSARSWGMGDFGDLRRLVDIAADAGAHFVGVNPLHALFPYAPEHANPYSPSNREWLNVLYLDIESMRDFAECVAARERVASAGFRARLDALHETPLVDYAGVAATKLEVLELLYQHFRSLHLDRGTQRAGLFRDFQREGGRSLRLHALFDALQAHFRRLDPAIRGWTSWPEAYRDAQGSAVEAFALENELRIEFFEYLQWQAEGQLQAVASRARARGMRVGLCRDLAMGVNEAGSETWTRPTLHASGARAGAPPDESNPAGRDRGFPPVIPQRLADEAYAPFLAVLRANMRHAGALRLERVTALMRLFWLPGGLRGAELECPGAYVASPMQDLLGLLSLESRSHNCVMIGEGLGDAPPVIREGMARHGLLACRSLYFAHEYGDEGERTGILRPPQWPEATLAVVGTHKLPTLRGYWSGHDLELRRTFGLYRTAEQHERQAARRREDCEALIAALRAEDLLATDAGIPPPDHGAELAPAVYRFLARSPAAMLAVQLEDVLDQLESADFPGTTEEAHPNWRRKLEVELADLAVDPRWLAVAAAIAAERPSTALPLSGGPPGFHPERADIPLATYRLQFNSDFGFAAAEAILPYLAELGISHVYAAPFLKARPGSRHGYDIVDHHAVNPEVGSNEDFDRYCARLSGLALGQILDIVPNHVGVGGDSNAWWLDVLENGPASTYAGYFDIDWDPPFPELRGKVLLPVLGDQYGRELEAGALHLTFSPERGDFSVTYYEHRFPVDPCDYPLILAAGLPITDDGAGGVEFETLVAALRRMPPRGTADTAGLDERRRDKETFKRHLAALHARSPELRARIASALATFNGEPGRPESFDALDRLLSRQAYRLASWRVAADDINYRRFFDINDLAALRMESDVVFEATHARIFDWIAQGRASGLRVDHADGLADPRGYFERLQARHAEIAPQTSGGPHTLYLVVEKIFGEFETLPTDWPVHGTTGYRFAALCNNLFVDPTQESRLSRIYRAFTGESRSFSQVLLEAKHLIITHSLPGELSSLAYLLYDIARYDRHTRDFTRSRLRSALAEVIAAFPVYRSYIDPQGVSASDRRHIERAVEEAVSRGRAGDASVLRFVRGVLLSAPVEADEELRRLKLRFATRFQQFTAPVMAKAMEDTAFYRYNRLVSLNDVGADPRNFGIGIDDFHVANERIAWNHPFSLLASSTHDSKRSEDVRARIDVLSEMPGPWRLALRRWRRINERRKVRVNDAPAPSSNDEYLLYQTLLGIWPLAAPDEPALAELADRVEAFMLKAAREAKLHTSWMNPEPAYEAALSTFVRRLFGADGADAFLADFLPFQALVARFGILNSLNMLLVKLTAPGVPDIYQGCERWNFSLVDPDNRRAVDFETASRQLGSLRRDFPEGAPPASLRAMLEAPEDGRLKLYLLWRTLAVRKRFEHTFRFGRYVPLDVEGPAAGHVLAFARVLGKERIVVIATRLHFGLTHGNAALAAAQETWAGTFVTLPWRELRWREELTGGRQVAASIGRRPGIELAELFNPLPLALLVPNGSITS